MTSCQGAVFKRNCWIHETYFFIFPPSAVSPCHTVLICLFLCLHHLACDSATLSITAGCFWLTLVFLLLLFLSIFFPVHDLVKRESYYSAENFHWLLMCGPCFAGTHLAFNAMIHAGVSAANPFSTQSFLSAAYRLVYRRRTVADLELQSKSGHNNTSTLFLMSVLDPRGILSTLHGCACSL